MKITHTILALLAAGFLGQTAFAGSDMNTTMTQQQNGCTCPQPQQNLAVVQDGHGYYHFLFYQVTNTPAAGSVALSTASGGVITSPMTVQNGPLPDNGQTKYVIGTNQHGNAHAAYIPVTSHFAQAGQ
ncbi:MAG TPA: hypothetical protein VHY22_09835 [Chthoniobacteraceae bacterium]|jgi:hypothetical protein|nr:hypothetical protein [Chthoniobacteraceae bacterium]